MQKGQTGIFVLAGILILAIIAGGAYYLGKSTTPKSSPAPAVTSPAATQRGEQTPQPTPSPDASREPTGSAASPAPTGAGETANWKTITKDQVAYGYVFKFPDNWVTRAPNDTSESGMVIRTRDLDMVDYSNISKGAFISVPYTLGIVSNIKSLGELFASEKSYLKDITILEEKDLTLDGQPAKERVYQGKNMAGIQIVFKYPRPFRVYDIEANFSTIQLITSRDELDMRKQELEKILSTFKFIN